MELLRGNRKTCAGVLASAVTWLLSTGAVAQSEPQTKQDAEAQQPVGTEVYKRPYVKSIQGPRYGTVKCASCWVELALMVDAQGKPFEVMAIRSNGDKDLEREAVVSISESVFQPGTLDGKPVES